MRRAHRATRRRQSTRIRHNRLSKLHPRNRLRKAGKPSRVMNPHQRQERHCCRDWTSVSTFSHHSEIFVVVFVLLSCVKLSFWPYLLLYMYMWPLIEVVIPSTSTTVRS